MPVPLFFTLFLFFVLSIPNPVEAQTAVPYKLTYARDLTLSLSGSALLGTAYLLQRNKTQLSPEVIGRLDTRDINGFDRIATRNWKPRVATTSDILGFTSLILPAAFLLDKKVDRNFPVATTYFETFVITAGITTLAKALTNRKRPFVYNPEAPAIKKLSDDATASFFSGHTSLTAAACFYSAKVYTDHHPNSRFKPYAWTLAATIPAAVAFLRVRAGKHFPTDVMLGYAVGASVGFIVPYLHRANRNSGE